jgi:hypothetical protein
MQIKSHPVRDRVLKVILKVAWVGLLLLLILWLRVFYGSMEAYRTGETLLKENQTIRAITYFDRSLHWYAPINPYLERAATRLWEIGEKAQKEGDLRMARIAFESIRNASYGTTHVFTPGKEWIKRAESKINRLAAGASHRNDGNAEPWSPKKRPYPDAIWSVAVVLGFLGWVGSVLGFISAALPSDQGNKGTSRRILVWLFLIVAWGALWFAGMVMA